MNRTQNPKIYAYISMNRMQNPKIYAYISMNRTQNPKIYANIFINRTIWLKKWLNCDIMSRQKEAAPLTSAEDGQQSDRIPFGATAPLQKQTVTWKERKVCLEPNQTT
jgi:hypothetical protein